jgi:hypothetical protein
MTSKESMEFYALVGPDVARHIAEGGRIMGPVVEVSLGYKDGKPGFVIKGPSKEWKDAGEKINQILDVELGRLPPRTKTGLADIIRFISYFVPDEPLSLFQIEVWFSVPDGGAVRGALFPPGRGSPPVYQTWPKRRCGRGTACSKRCVRYELVARLSSTRAPTGGGGNMPPQNCHVYGVVDDVAGPAGITQKRGTPHRQNPI